MSARLHVDVTIACAAWDGLDFDPAALAQTIIPLTLDQAEKPPGLEGRELEVSLLLTDDAQVQILNRDYRGKDKPTNVLSFATLDDPDSLALIPAGEAVSLGDIIIAFQTIELESSDFGISLKDHYIHLLIHGLLHLLGYDHEENDEAEIMEALEINILSSLGIENPYLRDKFVP